MKKAPRNLKRQVLLRRESRLDLTGLILAIGALAELAMSARLARRLADDALTFLRARGR